MNVKCAKLKTKELLGLHFHSTHIKNNPRLEEIQGISKSEKFNIKGGRG